MSLLEIILLVLTVAICAYIVRKIRNEKVLLEKLDRLIELFEKNKVD